MYLSLHVHMNNYKNIFCENSLGSISFLSKKLFGINICLKSKYIETLSGNTMKGSIPSIPSPLLTTTDTKQTLQITYHLRYPRR